MVGPVRVTLENSEEVAYCHDEDACDGDVCPIHNRTAHHMRGWPQHWRSDRGLMERICPHGVGHPDPDHMASVKMRYESVASLRYWVEGVHGCDGCCVAPEETND